MDLKDNFRKSTHAYFSVLIKKLLKSFDESLFEQAEKATSNRDQTRYYEAMRELRLKSTSVVDRFCAFINQGVDDFFAGRCDTIEKFSHAPDELSLVDKDELEDELAIAIVTSRANTQYAESLWKLNRRLAVIRGGQKADDETNPCGPAHLCHAMQDAIQLVGFDNPLKIQLYKLFEKIVMPRAGEFYEKVNQHLIDKSILPNLQYELMKAVSSSGAAAAGAAAQSVGNPGGETGTKQMNEAALASQFHQPNGYWIDPQQEQQQQALLSSILALQGGGQHHRSARQQTAGGAVYNGLQIGEADAPEKFNAMDFAFALSAMQQKMHLARTGFLQTAKPVETVESGFIEQLKKLGAGGNRSKITEDDADTIDLVGMLFKYVLDDPKLPDSVKSLLSHLHTPMLKVALMDKRFFTHSSHSARRLLNLLAEIGGRWITDNREDKLVYPKLREIVSRILEEFIDDVSLFDGLLDDLSSFADSLNKRSELAEKRNTEAEKGLERLAKARLRAEEEISGRVIGHNIPPEIHHLLEKPWTDFLAFNLLRHGGEGKTWESALKVVDGVIWSVEPKQADQDVEQFSALQQKLDKAIRQGLKQVGYDEEASKTLLDDLHKAQMFALQQAEKQQRQEETEKDETESTAVLDVAVQKQVPEPIQLSPVQLSPVQHGPVQHSNESEDLDKITAEAEPQAAYKSTAITRQLQRQKQQVDSEGGAIASCLKTLESIEFGTWFEFHQQEKKSSDLLKLAWFSSISDHYMFVNRAGIKSAVKTQLELAKGMQTGLIKIVDGHTKTFMERALESILGRLKVSED